MTREEEIKLVASCHIAASNEDFKEYYEGFIAGAKWADKTMIDKAEKWLENFLEKTIQKPLINDGYTSDTIDLVELMRRRVIAEVLYDFKKEMEL